jgi:nucleoside-diphosphate kinase
MERSLVLIKPDAVERNLGCTILSRIESQGLKMIALKMLHMDIARAKNLYSVHEGKPFYEGLMEYMTSNNILAAVFEGENAVSRIRKIMGATDPAKADPGTIRKDFALDNRKNSVHGSDSPENAAREIAIFFKPEEILG